MGPNAASVWFAPAGYGSSARRIGAVALLLMGIARAEAADVHHVLQALDFPRDAEQRVLAGKFVHTTLPTRSERDLGVGIAFLVKSPPGTLMRKLREDRVLLRADRQTIAYGSLEGDGTPEQLARLRLTPAQVKAYRAPGVGEALNLSTQEIASLQAAGPDTSALERTIRGLLLARYRAYRAKGLAGIAPYARKGTQTDPAAELVAVVRGVRASGILPAAFCNLLDNYPQDVPADLAQVFYWAQFTAQGQDTIALVHAFQGTFDGEFIAVQRQYYVSTGFNTTQAVVGFLSVPAGTLAIYTNHTSTDQVTGVGGGAKRKIGRSLMASELETLFKVASTTVAQ